MQKKTKAEAAEKKRTARRARSERGHQEGPQAACGCATARRWGRIGIRLPADHDEISSEVAEQDVALDLRILRGTGHAKAHVTDISTHPRDLSPPTRREDRARGRGKVQTRVR